MGGGRREGEGDGEGGRREVVRVGEGRRFSPMQWKEARRVGKEGSGEAVRETEVKTDMTVLFMFQVSSEDSRLPKDTSASPHSGPSHISVLL